MMPKRKHTGSKIITFDTIQKNLQKKHDKKIVLVGGCFDIFHFGHLSFLKAAKEQGDVLVVALESDEFIRKFKKREPIHTQEHRAEILSHLTVLVDYVILLPLLSTYEEYLELVKRVSPAVIAISENDPHMSEKQKQAKEVDATLQVVTPVVSTASTSQIITYATLSSN